MSDSVDSQTSEIDEETLNLGHNGAGDDCISKVVTYGGNSALIGKAVPVMMRSI